MMNKNIAVIGLVLGLAFSVAGCATMTPEERAQQRSEFVKDIVDGKKGGLIFSTDTGCSKGEVTYINTETDAGTTWTFGGFYQTDEAQLTNKLFPMVAGNYLLSGYECQNFVGGYSYGYTETNKDRTMFFWFPEVTIKNGEVLYPGTIVREEFRKEFGKELNFGEKLTGRKERSTERLPLYDYADKSKPAIDEIVEAYPDISERVVFELQPMAISQEVAEEFMLEAYSKYTDVIPETDEEAAENRRKARAHYFNLLLQYSKKTRPHIFDREKTE